MANLQRAVPGALAAAILERHLVSFCYRGDPAAAGPRIVSPHAVYRAFSGKVCLQGVQLAGPTRGGQAALPGWRTFDLSRTSEFELLATAFEVAPEFEPDNELYRRMIIDCVRGWAGQPQRPATG